MKRLVSIAMAALTALAAAVQAHAQDAAGPASATAGAKIAQSVCSACHVVAKDQEFPPLLSQSTPSFEAIANDPQVSAPVLRRFINTTHWDEKTLPMTMPGKILYGSQTDSVIKYILSLKWPAGAAP